MEISGPTLIGFYPAASNAQLEPDEGLAAALDDFSYHRSFASDSLRAGGFNVQRRRGDTLWIRSGRFRSLFVRTPDSASIGFVLTDASGHQVVIYGVRTHSDLINQAREFKRTGKSH